MNNIPPMVRKPDWHSSLDARDKVVPSAGTVRAQVLRAIELLQPITAIELEDMECFGALAPSTVRKRVSELFGLGLIEPEEMREYVNVRGRKTRSIAWRRVAGVEV